MKTFKLARRGSFWTMDLAYRHFLFSGKRRRDNKPAKKRQQKEQMQFHSRIKRSLHLKKMHIALIKCQNHLFGFDASCPFCFVFFLTMHSIFFFHFFCMQQSQTSLELKSCWKVLKQQTFVADSFDLGTTVDYVGKAAKTNKKIKDNSTEMKT